MVKAGGFWSRNAKIIVISLVLLSTASLLAVGVILYWPRPIDVQIRSVDTNGAAIAIRSENLVDYTVNSLLVNIDYGGESIGQLRKDNFVVRSRAETVIKVPITSLSITKALITNCLDSKDLPVQIHVEVDLRIISWTGYRIRNSRTIVVPCAGLVRSVIPKGNRKLADSLSKINLNQLKLANLKKELKELV